MNSSRPIPIKVIVLVSLLLIQTLAFTPNPGFHCVISRPLTQRPSTSLNFFRKSISDDEKERQFQEQQAILARRKDPKKKKQYFEDMEKRRKNLDKDAKERILKDDGKDPLIQWKAKRKAGIIKDFEYDESPEGSLPLPASPIQVPRFDNGERFDLRLPYVDRGYEDPDADVMGKLASFFGGGKKEKKPEVEVKEPKTQKAVAKKAIASKKPVTAKTEAPPKKKGWWN
mmetsp:Transcript_39263/g.51767  ORF Transcript_39263/g.51767 Transcript_39263/m.51767 type:complete len:228 (-) Transcript_39263:277-960(-)